VGRQVAEPDRVLGIGDVDERVWAVDVGMSRAYGGPIQLLEIVDDRTLRVLQP
jgi:hypothetical protein